jgi:hypothetical protein
MRLPPAPLRLAQPKRSDETDIRTLYLCDRYPADQVSVSSPSPPPMRYSFFRLTCFLSV